MSVYMLPVEAPSKPIIPATDVHPATIVSGLPSESKSLLAQAFSGHTSVESSTPSPSSSVSVLSPVPSPSVSTVSVLSSGNASSASMTPSPSSSMSRTVDDVQPAVMVSALPSLSVSVSAQMSYGNASLTSRVPSASSSVSALSPVPSPS